MDCESLFLMVECAVAAAVCGTCVRPTAAMGDPELKPDSPSPCIVLFPHHSLAESDGAAGEFL